MSKVLTDQIEKRTGGTAIDLPATGKWPTANIADSIITDITANTAKVTNATHTGDVTGATALTIATDAVDIAMLSATGTAQSGTYLQGDNTWGAIASAGFTSVQAFTASGTWTKPTDITKILVFITGGGAAGTRISGSFGMGGGAGGTAIKFLDVSAIASVAVTIGAGGLNTGTGSSPSYGNPGGASAFGVAPATVHCTANGGSQGSSTGLPGAGGTATGGDLNPKGGLGDYQGKGGDSFWGGGSSFGYNGSSYVSPQSLGTYGSGGGGARDAAGGNGEAGACFVMEFK